MPVALNARASAARMDFSPRYVPRYAPRVPLFFLRRGGGQTSALSARGMGLMARRCWASTATIGTVRGTSDLVSPSSPETIRFETVIWRPSRSTSAQVNATAKRHQEITRFRLEMQLRDLWVRRRMTVIFVTHSVFESVYLSQRVVVMTQRPGRLSADLRIETSEPRTEDFRTSAGYGDYCRKVSAALAPSYAGQPA